MGRDRAYVVWAAGLFAYLVGVLHRTSFGVAGLDAAARFDADPAVLSGFVVLQLLVYAALQVPVGILLDRFGAKAMVVVGALLMSAGQVVLALATALPIAITARVLVGAGDAMTFISVLSVLGVWFPPRRVPVIAQLTGLIGQLGQVLSAVPLAAILHRAGWTPAFLSAAGLGVFAALAVAVVFRDRPAGEAERPPAPTPREVLVGLRHSGTEPGTWLGMWTHLGTQFSGTVFGLMWGVPYLVAGHGVAQSTASALLSLLVGVGIAVGPIFGTITARHPFRRSYVVIGVIVGTAAMWTVVLLVPPPAPLWMLVVLVVVLALGPPGSMIGFDFARTFNPEHRQGTAVGIVNVGGFTASLLTALAIGIVLERLGGYTPEAFRWAMTVQYVFWALAIAGVLAARARARRNLAATGVEVPTLRAYVRRRRSERAVRPR